MSIGAASRWVELSAVSKTTLLQGESRRSRTGTLVPECAQNSRCKGEHSLHDSAAYTPALAIVA